MLRYARYEIERRDLFMKYNIFSLKWKSDMDLRKTVISLMNKAVRNKWFQAACIAALIFIIYYATQRGTTLANNHIRLADAFLHGRLYLVDAPDWLEVAWFDGKAFVILPPAPALFALPCVAIWGLNTNQNILVMLIASGAMGLFWVAATQLGWNTRFRIAMIILFAFGTNFWWAALDGGAWQFCHISAIFFFMAALVETTGRNRPWLIGLLVGLAGLSRFPVFIAFPFFAYTISQGVGDRRVIIRRLVIFGLALAAMGAVYLMYNYARFGTLLDQGYYHPEQYSYPYFDRGIFDIGYIPRQLNAILFAVPKFTEEFPYFKPTLIGLGLFFTTPALLYMFRARLRGFTLAALVGLIAVAVPIVTYWSVGWIQFGYRYSLDFLPFMIMLVASGMHYQLGRLKIAVILVSCGVCLWGILSFFWFYWVA